MALVTRYWERVVAGMVYAFIIVFSSVSAPPKSIFAGIHNDMHSFFVLFAQVSSIETDLETRFIQVVSKIGTEGLKTMLLERKVEWVDWEGWRRIDAEEVRLGALVNKPREKIVDKSRMLEISRARSFATDFTLSINE